MALAVIAVVPPAMIAGIYYWIVIHEGSPLLAAPVVVILPFALHALIRGWLRSPPAVRCAPELLGGSSRPPQSPQGRPIIAIVPRRMAQPLTRR